MKEKALLLLVFAVGVVLLVVGKGQQLLDEISNFDPMNFGGSNPGDYSHLNDITGSFQGGTRAKITEEQSESGDYEPGDALTGL